MVGLTSLLLQLASAAPSTAFVDVTVVPMTARGPALKGQTVIVRGGRVSEIGPVDAVPVPVDVVRIDGRGRFLIPGLMDMHAHLEAGDGREGDPVWRQLALSTALGVTTVRSLESPSSALAVRDAIRHGRLIGPRLVLAGKSVNGSRGSAPRPFDVVREVETQYAAGYDLIKTHGMWEDSAAYDSLVAVTRRLELPLVGHVTQDFGLERAMQAGQQIEHLDGVLALLTPPGVRVPRGQFITRRDVLDAVTPERIDSLARIMVSRGIWNGPTLALFRVIAGDDDPDVLLQREEMRYVSGGVRAKWAGDKQRMRPEGVAEQAAHAAFLEFREQFTAALVRHGGRVLASSDSPQLFMVPGFALHRELQALERAGLTPEQALASATRWPAEWFGEEGERGSVSVGAVADLVLLEADPLEATVNLMAIAGTMIGGRWLDRFSLDALMTRVEESTQDLIETESEAN